MCCCVGFHRTWLRGSVKVFITSALPPAAASYIKELRPIHTLVVMQVRQIIFFCLVALGHAFPQDAVPAAAVPAVADPAAAAPAAADPAAAVPAAADPAAAVPAAAGSSSTRYTNQKC